MLDQIEIAANLVRPIHHEVAVLTLDRRVGRLNSFALELDGEVFSLRISDSDNSVPRILTNRPFRVSAMFGLRLAVFMFTSSILSTQSISFTSSTSTTPSTPSDFSRVNH